MKPGISVVPLVDTPLVVRQARHDVAPQVAEVHIVEAIRVRPVEDQQIAPRGKTGPGPRLLNDPDRLHLLVLGLLPRGPGLDRGGAREGGTSRRRGDEARPEQKDRKSTRLNSSHVKSS